MCMDDGFVLKEIDIDSANDRVILRLNNGVELDIVDEGIANGDFILTYESIAQIIGSAASQSLRGGGLPS